MTRITPINELQNLDGRAIMVNGVCFCAAGDPVREVLKIAGTLRLDSEKAHYLLDAISGLSLGWPENPTQVSYADFRKIIVFCGMAQEIIENIVAHSEAIEMVTSDLGRSLEHRGACH